MSNLIRTLAELDAYRNRLALLKYRLEAGEQTGLATEATAYIEHLASIADEAPTELRRVVSVVIKDYQNFIRECHDVR